MEKDSIIRDMKERICNLEQALFLASKLISKYEQLLEQTHNQKWPIIREDILNEGSFLKK